MSLFIALPSRERVPRRWATPVLFALLWTSFIAALLLPDAEQRRLLVDWRSLAAEPFFGATHGNPMGLVSRRRYRWTRGRVNDYWDEVFTPDGLEGHAALDDQSAFIASLGSSRSARMRDVLSTLQADQDAIVRAGSRGALVVACSIAPPQDRSRKSGRRHYSASRLPALAQPNAAHGPFSAGRTRRSRTGRCRSTAR